MTELVRFAIQRPIIGPEELMQRLADGLAEISANSFEGNLALILSVPAGHAEQVEEAARRQDVELRRIP